MASTKLARLSNAGTDYLMAHMTTEMRRKQVKVFEEQLKTDW